MSAKKVRTYIKAQRRAQKQAQRDEQTYRHGRTSTVGETASASTVPRRSLRVTGGRWIAVLAGLGLIAAAGGSATFEFTDDRADQRVSQQAQMVPAPAVTEMLVCPPTPGEPGSLSGDGVLEYQSRDESAVMSRTAALFASADGQLPSAVWRILDHDGPAEPDALTEASEGDGSNHSQLVDRPLTTGTFDAGEGAAQLQISPLEELSPADDSVAAAYFAYQADSGAVTGLTAGQCKGPSRSHWFIGPETGSGADSLLTLTNSYDRDATVQVRTFDAEGETGTLGSTTVLVPGSSVRSVNLAALTEGESNLAVHVEAQGAPVTSHLQSSRAVSETGQGIEQLEAMGGPLRQHHALGVLAGAEEDPQLWFYVPGEEHATVELQVFDAEGQAEISTPGVFSVEPGRVTAAGLHGLEPGVYDVVLTTDQPTVAAVRSSGDGQPVTAEVELEPEIDPWTGLELDPETEEQEIEPATDFSWSAAASPLSEGFGALLPTGYDTELRFLAPPAEEPAQVTYRLFDSQGQSTEDLVEEIEPGSSLQLSAETLQDHAESADLEDIYAVLVVETRGEAYGGTVTRDEEGRFTAGSLAPIAGENQYIPMLLQP